MNKYKKALKQELVEALPSKPTFDTSVLPNNEHVYINFGKIAKKSAIAVGALAFIAVAGVGGIILSIGLHNVYSTRRVSRTYSPFVSKKLEEQYASSLNEVSYPSVNGSNLDVSDEFVSSIKGFANKAYQEIKGYSGNTAFTPISLYSNMMMASYASEGYEDVFDEVLGLNKDARLSAWKNLYQNDYFVKNDSSLQMYNASFQSQEYEVNQNYVDELTSMFAESYKVDFSDSRTLDLIASWANEHVGEDLVNRNDIEIENPLLYLFSTFYFKSSWSSVFVTSSTKEAPFLLDDGKEVSVPFMNHLYGGRVLDFGKYLKFSDSYSSGMKITYFTPKDRNDNILALMGNEDIFDEENGTDPGTKFIDLKVPKFTSSYSLDATEAMKAIGLNDIYSKTERSIARPFTNYPSDQSAYMEVTKEKNKIEMDEDGTKVTSVTFSLGAGAAQPMPSTDTYEITLDSTFLYYISDATGAPLFVGLMRNPQ